MKDNISPEMWELEQRIVEVLVRRLEESPSTITYGDLAKKINDMTGSDDARAWHYFDASLGRIQDSCVELGLPSLPVMVVLQDSMKPGGGYAAHYREAHPEVANLSDVEIGKIQWDKVRACKNWQALLDFYGIDYGFAGPKDMKAELFARESYEEGRKLTEYIRNEVRRSPEARKRCIELKGATCVVCGFNSEEVYGVAGIIHVHHLRPLFEISAGESADTDPVKDLVPVCPNCHAFIHSKGAREWYTIEEARAALSKGSSNN